MYPGRAEILQVVEAAKKVDVEALEKSLMEKVYKRRIRLKERFVDFDHLRTGSVSPHKFRTALTIAGLDDLSEKEFAALEEHYKDKAVPGQVRYVELIEKLEEAFVVPNMEQQPTATVPALAPSAVRKPLPELAPAEEARVAKILDRIRNQVRIHRLEVKQPFDDFMRNENSAKMMHRVTRQQFRQVLGRLHVELTNEEADLLARKFDTHRDTSVNYVEFCVLVDEAVAAALPPALGGTIATAKFSSGYRKDKVVNTDSLHSYQPGRPPVVLDEPRLATASTVPPKHDELDPVMARLAETVMVRSLRLKEFFRDFDRFSHNKMSVQSFRMALSIAFDRLRTELTEREFLLLCKHYGTQLADGSPAVRWRDFIGDVEQLIDPPRIIERQPLLDPVKHSICAANNLRDAPPGREVEWEELHARLRKITADRSLLLKPAFQNFSSNALVDHVTRAQFLQALKTLNIPVSSRDAELLFHRYDTHGDGTVHFVLFCAEVDDYEHFSARQSTWNKGIGEGGYHTAKWLPPDPKLPFGTYVQPGRAEPYLDQPRLPSSKPPAGSAEEVVRELQVAAKRYGIRVEEFLSDFDRHRARKITPEHFRMGLRAAFDKRLALAEVQVQALINAYGAEAHGAQLVRWKDFTDAVNEVFTTRGLERRPLDSPSTVTIVRSLVDLDPDDQAKVDAVLDRFARLVRQRSLELKPSMRDFERAPHSPHMIDHITQSQFRQSLAVVGLDTTNEEFRLLCQRYDTNRDGSVDYVLFCSALDPQEAAGMRGTGTRSVRSTCGYHHPRVLEPAAQHSYQPGRPPLTHDQPRLLEKPAADVDELIARMRRKCQNLRLRVDDTFRDHDHLNSGAVTIDAFRSCVARAFDTASLALTEKEFAMLVQRFRRQTDKPGAVLVNWREFTAAVDPVITGLEQNPLMVPPPMVVDRSLPTLSEEKEAKLADIIARIRHRFVTRRVLLKPFFTDFAKSRMKATTADHVTRKQFLQALSTAGIELPAQEMALIYEKFDDSNDLSINYVAFTRAVDPMETYSDRPSEPRQLFTDGYFKSRVILQQPAY